MILTSQDMDLFLLLFFNFRLLMKIDCVTSMKPLGGGKVVALDEKG